MLSSYVCLVSNTKRACDLGLVCSDLLSGGSSRGDTERCWGPEEGRGWERGPAPPGWRLLPRSAEIYDLRSVCCGLLPFHHSGRFTGSNFHVRGTAERCASSSLSLSQHKMPLVWDAAALPCGGHPQVPRAAPAWPEAGRYGSPQLSQVPCRRFPAPMSASKKQKELQNVTIQTTDVTPAPW